MFFAVNIDLTITTEKLVELFAIKYRSDKVDAIGHWLDIPRSKIEHMWKNYQSPAHCRDAYLDLYASDHPFPSWRTISEALRSVHLPHQANVVESAYIKGTIIIATLYTKY